MLVCCRMPMRRMYGHRSDSSLETWMVILWLSRGLCKAHRRARKRSSKPLRVSLQDSSGFTCHTLLFRSHLFTDYKYCDWKAEFDVTIWCYLQQMLLQSSVLCLPLKKNLLILLWMMKTVALLNILVPTIIKKKSGLFNEYKEKKPHL